MAEAEEDVTAPEAAAPVVAAPEVAAPVAVAPEEVEVAPEEVAPVVAAPSVAAVPEAAAPALPPTPRTLGRFNSAKELALSIFQKHDKDGSGALDRTEATALIDDFCKTLNLDLAAREKKTLLDEQFVSADANGDGTLCWEEFHALAAYLDSIACALGGSVDSGGDMESVRVEKGTGHRRLLDDSGSANMALFEKYDANKDHMLDVDEGVALLKAVCEHNDLTTEWITPAMMKEQFRAAQGGVAPEGVALTKEEYEAFCKTIMTFMSHLGSTTLSDTPFEERLAAAREIDAAEKAAAMAAAPRRKGNCVLL